MDQSDEDYEAARELALELDFISAAKWLRAQTGCTLREGLMDAKRIASQSPGTPLAISAAEYPDSF